MEDKVEIYKDMLDRLSGEYGWLFNLFLDFGLMDDNDSDETLEEKIIRVQQEELPEEADRIGTLRDIVKEIAAFKDESPGERMKRWIEGAERPAVWGIRLARMAEQSGLSLEKARKVVVQAFADCGIVIEGKRAVFDPEEDKMILIPAGLTVEAFLEHKYRGLI